MSIRKIKKYLYIFIILLLVSGALSSKQFDLKAFTAQFQEEKSNSLEAATITKIVDGDTLKVDINEKSFKVRLIGIDTPESVNPDESKNTPDGKKASNYVKALLKVGQVVYLQKDQSETDKYGRLLRYVWLKSPDNVEDKNEIKKNMLNAIIVEAGYARAVEYKPDTRYKEIFADLERVAKKANKGIWK